MGLHPWNRIFLSSLLLNSSSQIQHHIIIILRLVVQSNARVIAKFKKELALANRYFSNIFLPSAQRELNN